MRIIRPNHTCTAVSSRTGSVALCDHENSTEVKFLWAPHSALRARNGTGDKIVRGPWLDVTEASVNTIIEHFVMEWISTYLLEHHFIFRECKSSRFVHDLPQSKFINLFAWTSCTTYEFITASMHNTHIPINTIVFFKRSSLIYKVSNNTHTVPASWIHNWRLSWVNTRLMPTKVRCHIINTSACLSLLHLLLGIGQVIDHVMSGFLQM